MTIYTRDNGQWDPREAIGVNLSPTVQGVLSAEDAAGVREEIDAAPADAGTPSAGEVVQKRRGTAAEWASSNPVLAEGEDGYETDTGRTKIGNGEDQWGDLEYVGGLGVPTDYSGTGDYMVNDVVRYTDPAPSPTSDLTGL